MTELPQMSERIELPIDDIAEPVTASKKRNREDEPPGGFGEVVDEEYTENVKVAKYEEGETPTRVISGEEKSENSELADPAPKKSLLLSSIFDTGDDGDYENEVERQRRLSYLTAMGAKQKKADRLDEKASFSAALPSKKKRPSGDTSSSNSRTAYGEFKSPSKTQPRTKMEKKEFVKDSVQSKIARETAPSLKPANSKSVDFDALMQRIAQRQTQIKLPTAEQVGLPTLVNHDLEEPVHDSESMEEESDEISLEIDEDEAVEPTESEKASSAPSRTSMPPPGPNAFQLRTKTLDMEEDEHVEVKQVVVQARQSVALPTSDTDQLLLIDDIEVSEIAAQAHLEAPVVTQIAISDDASMAVPSQVSATPTLPLESPLQLEYPNTLTMAPETPLMTPGGVKLKAPSDGTSKPSLLSTWLSGQASVPPKGAKRGTTAVTKQGRAAKSTSSIPTSSPSSKVSAASNPTSRLKRGTEAGSKAMDTDGVPSMLLDNENAMSGETAPGFAGIAAKANSKLQKAASRTKAKQLFDEEAETGFGSDAEQVDAHERQSASDDESEGGQSQDEYEKEEGSAEETGEAAGKSGRFAGDIFESDDRAVIRSLQMKQEMEREAAEAREMEQLMLRRERRDRRITLELQSEARALQEARQMEERLAQRRAQRSVKKEENGGRLLETSVSMPVLPGRASGGGADWLLDDSDEDDEVEVVKTSGGAGDAPKPKHLLHAAKRFEALAEQQQRRRLASSSQYLSHDEDSQSILQVIDRANTQHSSRSDLGDGLDSPYASLSNVGDLFHRDAEASQDSLGGWFDRPALASSSFSASSAQHLTKLKANFKGNATQLQSSALLFQRSQDGFENSQDGFDSRASASPLSRSKYSLTASKPK